MTAKTRVLVVDDEAAILRFLKPALEANAYELTSAGTVAEALKRIAAEVPDIVVLDLGLPDGDGKDVIKRVREWSDVPIVILSARDREIEKIEALDLGADDFVNKPFGVGELMARMRTALRHRMQRKAETPVLKIGDAGDRQRAPSDEPRGARAEADPEGVRAAVFSCTSRRQGHHAQANPCRGVGPGSHRRYAISAGLRRTPASKD